MTLDLVNYDELARLGVRQFWSGRGSALEEGEGSQGGERSKVLAGKNMDGFLTMIELLVQKNGLPHAQVFTRGRPDLTLPGYYRPTKLWDVIVLDEGKLVAAIELKSHVGSFGNNFNNRAEEAIGTAHDLITALREDVLGQQSMPFLAWLILVEDSPKARCQTRSSARHFPVLDSFLAPVDEPADPPATRRRKLVRKSAPRLISYLERYDLLCHRLMTEQLYTRAAVMASPRAAVDTGDYVDMSPDTSLRAFVTGLAAHVAAWSANKQSI